MSYHSLEFKSLGTIIHLQIDHPDADSLLQKGQAMIQDFHQRFSANDADSQLTSIAHYAGQRPVQVDSDLYQLIDFGKKESLASNGALNIAIGPLIKLWHIGFHDARKPSQAEIEDTLKRINPKDIILNPVTKTVYLKQPGMELDLGALAKGYIADQLKAYYIKASVSSGLIDLGGNVLTIGPSKKQADGWWRVGIQKPGGQRGTLIGVLLAKDESVVTSGIYERTYTDEEGNNFHHIFNSRTGYPIETDLASVTILSKKSIAGELWTSLLFHDSLESALEKAESIPNIEAILISKTGEVRYTKPLQPRLYLPTAEHHIQR